MDTFIAVCLALIVLEIGVMMGAVVFVALKLKKSAEAVEVLAYRVEDRVMSFRTGWLHALQGAASLVTGILSQRRN
jgi:hypothetical protein